MILPIPTQPGQVDGVALKDESKGKGDPVSKSKTDQDVDRYPEASFGEDS